VITNYTNETKRLIACSMKNFSIVKFSNLGHFAQEARPWKWGRVWPMYAGGAANFGRKRGIDWLFWVAGGGVNDAGVSRSCDLAAFGNFMQNETVIG